VTAPARVAIATQADVERARSQTRRLALSLGFGREDAERVTLAVSEMATNLLKYAQDGRIEAARVSGPRGTGIQVESRDGGPGIADIPSALRDGYSTGGGLGSGLPGVVRLMDDVEIESDPSGTHIKARKWILPAS
jgi:serine/threonine-protein kinase RsbT